MLAYMTALVLASAAATPIDGKGDEQGPPPFVELALPRSITRTVSALCEDRQIIVQLEESLDSVRVISYSGASGIASVDELKKWTKQMEALSNVYGVFITCHGKIDNVMITGTGQSGAPGQSRVVAIWNEGKMRFTP